MAMKLKDKTVFTLPTSCPPMIVKFCSKRLYNTVHYCTTSTYNRLPHKICEIVDDVITTVGFESNNVWHC